ncbi:hypothetical protein WA158_000192 [Blastocystis sp. Blastoise]
MTQGISQFIKIALVFCGLISISTILPIISAKHEVKEKSIMLYDTFNNDTCAYEIMDRFECEEPGCTDQANLINYLYIQYCEAGEAAPYYGILWGVLVLVLIYLLITTADVYFCGILEGFVQKLHIPPNIAGVTFLSFGNGVPDLFSMISSVIKDNAAIGLGSNVGGGLFVTTIVVGAVSLVSHARTVPSAFLRDISFYIGAVIYLGIVFFNGNVNIFEALGFLIIYAIFVLLVIFGRKFFDNKPNPIKIEGISPTSADSVFHGPSMDGKQGTGMVINTLVETKASIIANKEENTKTIIREILSTTGQSLLNDKSDVEKLIPVPKSPLVTYMENDYKEFLSNSYFKRCLLILEFPFTLLRNWTIPMVMEDNWNRYNMILSGLFSPAFFIWTCGYNLLDPVFGSFPYWALALILGVIFAVILFFTTCYDHPPENKYYLLFLLLIGFVMVVQWTSLISGEVVSLLSSIGLMINIPAVVLGLTILAWGNSLGDLIADTAIAKDGYPQMAIGGAFAGPMFNMLIGNGLALTIKCIMNGSADLGEDTASINMGFIFLLVTLIASILTISLQKFTVSRPYGIILIVIYCIYMILNLLGELHVIDLSFLEFK